MAQLLVRNVSDFVVAELKRRAEIHGRSAEAEHRSILENTLSGDREAFIRETDAFRAKLKDRPKTDSTEIIRQMRDER